MKKNIFLLLFVSSVLFGCQKEAKFHATGHILEAADTMLYLEHITLGDGIVAIDSVKLSEDGYFDLKGDTCYNPEFYRLRIGRQCINFAIDSTETLNFEARLPEMSFGYKVKGSGVADTIRLLSLKLADLERRVDVVADDRSMTIQERQQRIMEMLTEYKTGVKIGFIQNHYSSPASYFACFQVLGNTLVFDPSQDKSDMVWLRAVANAWNENWPGAPRTQNLTNIVASCKKNLTPPRQIVLDVSKDNIQEVGIIDMTFPDSRGKEISLSSLKGKVVLLDFTAFELKESHQRTIMLRELYQKYHSRGFEIYQVGLDVNYNFWQQQTDNLPWVSVYCKERLDSDILKLYQVNALPYYFLIDRNSDLQARMENIPDLEKAIEALL